MILGETSGAASTAGRFSLGAMSGLLGQICDLRIPQTAWEETIGTHVKTDYAQVGMSLDLPASSGREVGCAVHCDLINQ